MIAYFGLSGIGFFSICRVQYTESQVNELIRGIYAGKITEYDLPEDLYYAIADRLKAGLFQGFGGTLGDFPEGSTDYELLAELRENVYMFSAAKTFQQLKEMTALLTDEDGVKAYREFKQDFQEVFDRYNEDYLQTEYITAIGQAQAANQWVQIEDKKEVLPYLRYSATGGEQVCDICGELDGLTLPVDDPIWNTVYPTNHFRCMCVVEQIDKYEDVKITPEGEAKELEASATAKMQDIFKHNIGKTGEVFSKEHPYFEVPKEDKAFAKRNFDLPIPKINEDDE